MEEREKLIKQAHPIVRRYVDELRAELRKAHQRLAKMGVQLASANERIKALEAELSARPAAQINSGIVRNGDGK